MKLLPLLLVTLLITTCSFAQNSTDPIEVKKTLGTVFMQNGEPLKPRHLVEITSVHPEAHQYMKTAKTNHVVGTIIGSAGGFLVGWPIGTMMGGGEPNWALAGIGAGLIVVSIPFTAAYTKNAKRAVEIYNSDLRRTSSGTTEINFAVSGTGFGLKVSF